MANSFKTVKSNNKNGVFIFEYDGIYILKENVDKVAEVNVGLLSGYQSQRGYLTKIYPVCILFLLIGFIYLSYLTYRKFMNNVWSQYKD